MGRITLQGNPPIDVELRRSARARRLSLRVSRLDGRVTLTLPNGVAEEEGRRFARSKADWIAKARLARPDTVPVDIGAMIPVDGRLVEIVPGDRPAPVLNDARLEAPERRTGRAIQAFLVERARARATGAIDRYTEQIGRAAGRLTLRDTRSRWGSCSAEGNLMLSWRLILAPPEVFDYVVAHEVAHLAEMNHGPRFWAAVERLLPGYEAPRAWLKREGRRLHAFDFGG